MDPTAYIILATEILKAYNGAQADKDPKQRREEAAIWYAMSKPVLRLILPPEVKKALAEGGITI